MEEAPTTGTSTPVDPPSEPVTPAVTQPSAPEPEKKPVNKLTVVISIVMIVVSMLVIYWAFSGASLTSLFGGNGSSDETENSVTRDTSDADIVEEDEEDSDGEHDDDEEDESVEESSTLDDVVVPSTTCANLIDYDSGEVTLDTIEPEGTLTSPHTLSGQIPGTWMFEGSFSVLLYDVEAVELGQWIVSIAGEGDWMVEGDVPFTGDLTFDPGDSVGGTLVLRAANPSSEEGNCREMNVVVSF